MLTLASASLEMNLQPSVGGSIGGVDFVTGASRAPVLRSGPDPSNNIRDAACFPLIPFANRIRGGCFQFRGREVRLSPNVAGEAVPLHGHGWLAEWRVESSSRSEAVLAFDHPSGEWPWAYEARQHFILADNCLDIRLTCRNRSSDRMPCGLGLHPRFNCGPETRIQTSVEDVWAVDETLLPTERLPATGRYDIADAPICGRDLNNGYGGWSGRAIFTDPDWPFELELSSPDARFLQIYSPSGRGFVDAEPVSHANAALNAPEQDWPMLGIQLLEPGQEVDFEMRLDVRVR